MISLKSRLMETKETLFTGFKMNGFAMLFIIALLLGVSISSLFLILYLDSIAWNQTKPVLWFSSANTKVHSKKPVSFG